MSSIGLFPFKFTYFAPFFTFAAFTGQYSFIFSYLSRYSIDPPNLTECAGLMRKQNFDSGYAFTIEM